MPERGLRALDESGAHVRDAEEGLVRRGDVVVDDGAQLQGDVVLGHAHLEGNLWCDVSKQFSC